MGLWAFAEWGSETCAKPNSHTILAFPGSFIFCTSLLPCFPKMYTYSSILASMVFAHMRMCYTSMQSKQPYRPWCHDYSAICGSGCIAPSKTMCMGTWPVGAHVVCFYLACFHLSDQCENCCGHAGITVLSRVSNPLFSENFAWTWLGGVHYTRNNWNRF